MNTFIIAEAGANHDRKIEQAFDLIDIAFNSGADAVKFQTYSSETLYSKNTPDIAGYKNLNKLIKNIELPRSWQKDLKKYCDDVGIEFMSTPFDEKAVEELVDLGVKRLKISGFESTDFRFVEMVASAKLPLIVSLGIGWPMNYLGKIFEVCEKYGNELTLLHCNNAYPTPPEDINLGTIKSLSLDSRYKTGLSDHTMSPLTPALAVAAGAEVIEKHFTVNRSLIGPDHPFSLEPDELKKMVEYIRFAEKVIGHKTSRFTDSEKKFKDIRRAVVTKRNIKSGEILSTENITTKRPCLEGAVPAIDFFGVLGHRAGSDIEEDTHVMKEQVKGYYETTALMKS